MSPITPIGEYKDSVPDDETVNDKDLRAGMETVSRSDTESYRQEQIEAKMADPGFFSFASARAEADGGNVTEYVADTGAEIIVQLAEQYDAKVKPIVAKFVDFSGKEFFNKIKLLQGKDRVQAEGAILSHLGKEAAKDIDAFNQKYTELFNRFEQRTAEIKQLRGKLEQKYGTSKNSDLVKIAGEQEAWATKHESAQDDNDKMGAMAKQHLNSGKMQRFAKGLRSRLRQLPGMARIISEDTRGERAEDAARDENNEKLDEEITKLRARSAEIKSDLATKNGLEADIDVTRRDIFGELESLDELRDVLMKATESALTSADGFDADSAAQSLDAMNGVWREGLDDTADATMKGMLKIVYERVVEESTPEDSARAINPSKMKEFNRFVSANISNPSAIKAMKEVIDEKIPRGSKSADIMRTPKGAQLALMRRRVEALG
jgi:hypothetical protein